MANLNQVMLLGNLGRDPECLNAKDTIITRISLATQRYSKAQGKQLTDWHTITLFGQSAKFTYEELKKGDSVLVEGFLQTSRWKNDDGISQNMTEIIGEKIQIIKIRERPNKEQVSADFSMDTI